MDRSYHVVQLYPGKVGVPSNHAVIMGWSLGLYFKLSKFFKLFSECGFSATSRTQGLWQHSCSFLSQPGETLHFLKGPSLVFIQPSLLIN